MTPARRVLREKRALIWPVAIALILIRQPSAVWSAYGALLAAKIFLFAALMAFAAANKWRLAPAIARGEGNRFRRSLKAEFFLIVIVLAIT